MLSTYATVLETLGLAGAVTGARLVLLKIWDAFRQATNDSNERVLPGLRGPVDVAVVACLPALAEEMLFRWALVPSIYPDWRGVLIAGCVFGVLHVNGGRNVAFAAWASVVGCAYGQLFLATGSIAAPIAAHSVSNIISACIWIRQRQFVSS